MDFLTSMLATFQGVLSLGMYNTNATLASLFWALAYIELVSFGGWWLYNHDPTAGAVVMRLMALMVFAWMMQHWQTLTGSLQDLFIALGISLGGGKFRIPTVHGAGMALIDKGFELFLAIQGRTADPSFWQRIGDSVDAIAPTQAAMEKWILAWCAYAAFIVAGIGMFLVQLQFALFSAVAFLTLPFAAWGKTSWITEKTFGSVMGCGVEIAFLYALAGIELIVFEHWSTPPVITQRGTVSIIAGGWFLVALMLAAHKLAGGILHGVPSLTQSDVLPRISTALALSSRSLLVAARAIESFQQRGRKGP